MNDSIYSRIRKPCIFRELHASLQLWQGMHILYYLAVRFELMKSLNIYLIILSLRYGTIAIRCKPYKYCILGNNILLALFLRFCEVLF